jgi:hypothetical protein
MLLHSFTWTNLNLLPNLINIHLINIQSKKQLNQNNHLTMDQEIPQKHIKDLHFLFDAFGV